jgi:uncharacterized protein (TIGR03067 family)
MRRGLLIVLALTGVLGSGVPVGLAREGADKLAGVWVAASAERNGKPADDLKGHQLTFRGDTFVIRSKDGEVLYQGTFRVDKAQRPAAIDFRHTRGKLEGKTWKGIYALEGDTLKTCDNGPDPAGDRPTDFSARAGSGRVSIVFKRGKI